MGPRARWQCARDLVGAECWPRRPLRGETGGDGAVNLSDALFTAHYLLRDPFGAPLECQDPVDTDDYRRVELDDVLTLLDYLFRLSNRSAGSTGRADSI